MRGYVTCKHCKGTGKKFRFQIIPIPCQCCNGKGVIWVDNIEEYYKRKEKEKE